MIYLVLSSLNRIFANDRARNAPLWSSKPSAEVPFNLIDKINEALCSSCILKPRKFQAQQEDMMASMRKPGRYSFLPYKVFLRTTGWRSEFCSTFHVSK